MRRDGRPVLAALTAAAIAAVSAASLIPAAAATPDSDETRSTAADSALGAVYTQTNSADGNEVLAFHDDGAGHLDLIGTYPTGGLGSGDGLGSEGAVTLGSKEKALFAVNAGSDTVTAFAVLADGTLSLTGQVTSGGDRPISVTASRGVGYVLNATSLDVASFTYSATSVAAVPDGVTSLSPGAAGPAQVSLSPDDKHVLVTAKTSSSLDLFAVTAPGHLAAPTTSPATGVTPFGFDFTTKGVAVVSEAGSNAAETFVLGRHSAATPLDLDSNGGQGAPCWVVVTADGTAFVANAAATANSISSFSVGTRGRLFLLNSRAAATDLHPTDMALGQGDTRLYNLSDQTGQINASDVAAGGVLTGTVAAVGGLPTTIVGLAATNR